MRRLLPGPGSPSNTAAASSAEHRDAGEHRVVLHSVPALVPSAATSTSSIPGSSGRHRHSSGWPQEGRVQDAKNPTKLRHQAKGRAEPHKHPDCSRQSAGCGAQPWAWQESGHRDLACSMRNFTRKEKPSEQRQHINKSSRCPPKRLQAQEKPAPLSPSRNPRQPQPPKGISTSPAPAQSAQHQQKFSTGQFSLGFLPEHSGAPARRHLHPSSCCTSTLKQPPAPGAWQGGEGRSWSSDWHLLNKH